MASMSQRERFKVLVEKHLTTSRTCLMTKDQLTRAKIFLIAKRYGSALPSIDNALKKRINRNLILMNFTNEVDVVCSAWGGKVGNKNCY